MHATWWQSWLSGWAADGVLKEVVRPLQLTPRSVVSPVSASAGGRSWGKSLGLCRSWQVLVETHKRLWGLCRSGQASESQEVSVDLGANSRDLLFYVTFKNVSKSWVLRPWCHCMLLNPHMEMVTNMHRKMSVNYEVLGYPGIINWFWSALCYCGSHRVKRGKSAIINNIMINFVINPSILEQTLEWMRWPFLEKKGWNNNSSYENDSTFCFPECVVISLTWSFKIVLNRFESIWSNTGRFVLVIAEVSYIFFAATFVELD